MVHFTQLQPSAPEVGHFLRRQLSKACHDALGADQHVPRHHLQQSMRATGSAVLVAPIRCS